MSERGAGPGHTRRCCGGCGPRARGGGARPKPRPPPRQTPPLSPSSSPPLPPAAIEGGLDQRLLPGLQRAHPGHQTRGPVAGEAASARHEEVGVVSLKHLYEVALVKQQDPAVALRGMSLPQLVTALVGSARSLGLRVVPRLTAEECAEFQRQRREQEAAMAQEEEEGAKK
ncbi:large ribosomal subunit protein uL11m isoform X2 [Melopsittacus undulatus]|uniref:large ribosomal subunit protein uL11m isoform X2 n=1 Tax=Melopsittacus undulatus TaxID=13146 RepID=UPI00146BA35B|nr:39S ribosomal protein L11, mitochondrial isoform X2 [Melopsittacus undulatus]